LEKLLCEEEDNTLQECDLGIAAFGLTTCGHDQDTWLQCRGTVALHERKHLKLSFDF